ncbi:hypothetical protein [Pontibacter burrus]|uniref:Uncharacterized protein n=1 Tax=Pontibacter burrus TaxID=2704466 RepID=A0A6B3LZ37_9BACT|nr:hypothetical protein [Pontibacter burrus]NEM99606.1 hypothetical protein [Pontibacter burrus]
MKQTIAAMFRCSFVFLALLCFACKEQKQDKIIVADDFEPEETKVQSEIHFEKITFSVMQGWNNEEYDKDYEIRKDGTFNYRLRNRYCCPIKANYTGTLDSLSMSKVLAVLDSIDFNTLKFVNYDEEHASFFSIAFTMFNGEVRFRGALDAKNKGKIRELVEIVEAQELRKSGNHKFSTAKDVIIPPPNFTPSQSLLDSL